MFLITHIIILFCYDLIKINNQYEGTFGTFEGNIETLVWVMIDDMESLDGLSGSSDDGIEQSQLFALNADVLGQIAWNLPMCMLCRWHALETCRCVCFVADM